MRSNIKTCLQNKWGFYSSGQLRESRKMDFADNNIYYTTCRRMARSQQCQREGSGVFLVCFAASSLAITIAKDQEEATAKQSENILILYPVRLFLISKYSS